jgi:hypothetical protein
MADVSGKFFSAKKVRTGVSPSSPGVIVGETLPPVNPPGGGLNSVGLTMPAAFAVANSPLTSNGTIEVTGAGTTAEYVRGDGSLATFPALTGFVPYTGATADVNLGTHDLTAERGTFENNGSSDTLTVNHTSGSGIGVKVTKGGNNEALLVTKTSGSGNAMAVVGGRTSLVDLSLSSVSNATGNFLTISGGVVHQRTPSETRSDVGAQAQLNGTGFVKASGTTITYDNSSYQVTSEKAQPNGYASLDSNGKVPLVQINDALIGNVNFQGLWNAATNTPTLANPPASGTKGYYYIVSTAGSFAGIDFEVGDWIISDGTAWGKVDNTDAVSSVFGRTGNVTATNGDYNTSQVTENTNLYYTEARVNANTNVAANTAARHNAVTLGTANGLSLSTQVLSLQLATSGQNGALSSTDWTTFNNKENAITAGTTAQYFRGDKTFQTLNTSVVPEGTNLYYTEARVNANTNVAANTAARHAAVTLGTANGLSLSTQQLSLGLASAGVTGALSGTDWSTFNSKQQALNGTGFVKISGTTISYDNSTYLTTAAAASTYLPLAGGTMTGNINWTANDVGLTWSRNTDGAAIKFISVGDGTGESYLQIGTSDNGNEAIVFTQTSLIRVQIDTDGLLKNGSSQKYVFENGGTWGIGITGNAGTVTNGVYTSRTITINGTTQDLSANRTYNVGTVTSVAALTLGTSGTDLSSSVANGTTTPVITLNVPTASAANRGALSASDWTTFNGKENAITAGTTAQYYRGDKTFQTLNTAAVPELTNLYYTEARVSANTDVAANTAARHNAVTLGTANGLSLSTQQLSLGLASSSANGALSSTDWTTFNNKQNALTNPVTGTGTTNYLPKFTGASTIGNSQIFDNGTNILIGKTTSTGGLVQISNGTNMYNFDYDASGPYFTTVNNANTVYKRFTLDASELYFNIAATTKMLLNSAGNLGLGVTPSAWYNAGNYIAFQVGNASLYGRNSTNSEMYLSANTFYITGTGLPTYITNDFATSYQQNDGVHSWQTAPSGTAGNTISFTQAMTLGSNSGLSIGTPSAAPAQGLLVQGEGRFSGNLRVDGTSNGYLTLNATSTGGNESGIFFQVGGTNKWENYTANNDTALNWYSYANSTIVFKLASTGAATFSSSVTAGSQLSILGSDGGGKQLVFTGGTTKYNFMIAAQQNVNNALEITPSSAAGGSTFSTPAVVVTGTGNVGIGTTSPSNLLDIGTPITNALYGFSLSYGATNVGVYQVNNATGELKFGGAAAGYFPTFYSGGTERMRITSAGRVLIGTPPPAESTLQLDVNGTGRFSGQVTGKSFLPAYDGSSLANQNSGIIFTEGTITSAFGFVVQAGLFFQGDWGLGNAVFGVKSPTIDGSNGTNVFTVSSTGAGTFSSSVTANGQIIQGGGTARSVFGTTVAFTRNVAYTLNSDASDNNRFLSVVNQSSIENAYSTLSFRVNPDGGGNNAMLDMKFVNLLNGSNLSNQVWSFLHNGSFVDRMNLSSNGRLTVSGNILTGVLKTTDDTELATDLGNVKIGTTSNAAADKLRVNGNIFTNTIRTYTPDLETRSVAWKLGASRGGTVTSNATVRVEIDGALVDLVARYV